MPPSLFFRGYKTYRDCREKPSHKLGEGEQSSGEVRFWAQVSFFLRHRRTLIFNFQFSIFN